LFVLKFDFDTHEINSYVSKHNLNFILLTKKKLKLTNLIKTILNYIIFNLFGGFNDI